MKFHLWIATLALALPLSDAWAEESSSETQDQIEEEIIVVAHPLAGNGLSQSNSVLAGDELARKLNASLGETLAREPGIHNSSFGQAVGRPVIHGLGGPRVRVMEDRIDTMDVSVSSPDHLVGIDPFIAERVEILKGSSALLYGSGAIGGVVDVQTGRIPDQVPEKAISGGIEHRYDDNSEGNNTAFKLNGGVGGFAWHLDGVVRDGDPYEIPGFAESARQIASEEEEHDEEEEEHEEEEEVRGLLPGSEFDLESYAGGASFVGDWGFVGLSVSRLEGDYGLPGGHGHEHEEGEEEEEEEEEEGNPVLDIEQTRVDVELGINNPFGNFERLNLRVGHNDYEHTEFEPNGEAGTVFENDAWEVRGELVYQGDAWRSVVGIQHQDREFSAVGEEAFVQPVDTTDTGVFFLAERDLGNFEFEGGIRLGQVDHSPSDGPDRDFDTYAVSLGIVAPISDAWSLGVLLDHSSRAPVAEELYSNGPHLATNSFEIGDPDLDEEVATGLSVSLHYHGEVWHFRTTAYATQFSDFIYEVGTGDEEDELPVFQFLQEDADFYGVDVELSARLADWDAGELRTHVLWDFVKAEVDTRGNNNVPRLPASRFGAGFSLAHGGFSAGIDYLRVFKQDDTAPEEFVTDAYNDVRAYVGYALAFGETTAEAFVQGKNLTDDEQRLHTSFIKDFAPAPGRTIEAGIRVSF